MKQFKVGDEVYIKGVIGKIERAEGVTYPVRVNLTNGYRVDDFTLGGLAKETHTERSLFHTHEIQSLKREYKIGQKLNGFAEVMQAILDGELVKLDDSNRPFRRGTYGFEYLSRDGSWDQTERSIHEFKSGTIVEDPTPKKMVAYKNVATGAFFITEKEIYDGNYQKSTKQELAAILERVE